MVSGVWFDYSGSFATPEEQEARRVRLEREKADESAYKAKREANRKELERLWAAAHPSEPFSYDAWSYD